MSYEIETAAETEKFNYYNHQEELRLTELFARLGIQEYFLTDRESFTKHDAFFNYNQEQYIVEAKVRNCTVKHYPTHILLKDKADYLFQHWLEDKKILYILFFQDGAILYNLSNRFILRQKGKQNHQLLEKKRLLVNNTAKDRGKREKVSYDLTPDERFLKDKILFYQPNSIQ